MISTPLWIRLRTWALSVSVRVKVMGIAVGMVLLLGLGTTARLRLSAEGQTDVGAVVSGDVLVATLVASVIGLLAAYGLTRILMVPLIELREAARRVETGEFTARARVWSDDEIGQLSQAFNNMAISLQRMQSELQRKEALRVQLLDKLIGAQEDERKRVARGLHDETSQSLTSLIVGLKVLESARTLAEARSQIVGLRAMAGRTLDEVHRLALELRPAVLDDYGLIAAVERHVADLRAATQLDVDMEVVGLQGERLPPRVEAALYRIVQESLTNVVRHANARHASVVLERGQAVVRLVIEDDGKGFDAQEVLVSGAREGHLGIYGMQERAAMHGGSLTIESAVGTGTTLFVEIPLS